MKPQSAPYGRAGSKVRLAPWIVHVASFIPHQKWGELFAGSCAVTINKPLSKWEFLNDKDEWISNFLRVLRDRKKTADLLRRLRYSAWERADFNECSKIIKGQIASPDDPVELARVFLVNNCQSFDRSGRTFSISDSKSGMTKWKRISKYVDHMADRIRDCTILNVDFAEALRIAPIDDPKMLIYVDPPYVGVETAYYAMNKRTGFDHTSLRDALEKCNASFLVSYEDHPVVRELYTEDNGWLVLSANVTRFLGNNAKRATELLLIRKSPWASRQSEMTCFPDGLQQFYGLQGESLL